MNKKWNKVKIIKLITLIVVLAICIYATIYLYPIIKNISTPQGQQNFKNVK